MTIAVTTPTGHVGRHLVRLLCQAGERPRLLMRDGARLDADLRGHVDVVAGDLRDPDYVIASTRDVDAVYWVYPEDWSLPSPNDDAKRTGAGFAAALRANRPPRVVFQSTVGAEVRSGAGFLDGMARIEEELDAAQQETGTALLHLRCAYFMTNLFMDLDGLRDGRLSTMRDLDTAMPWVAAGDVAAVAGARLLSRAWSGRGVQAVHGPADLTWHEAARALSRSTGRSIRAVRVSPQEQQDALRGAGFSDVAVEGIVGMNVGKGAGFTPEQARSALTTTPTTLDAWASSELRPLL